MKKTSYIYITIQIEKQTHVIFDRETIYDFDAIQNKEIINPCSLQITEMKEIKYYIKIFLLKKSFPLQL